VDIIEAIRSRKSIRGYKPDPVSKDTLKEILDIAVRAPSGMNTQAWEFTVIAGDVLEKIKQANVDNLNNGIRPAMEISREGFTGIYKERQVALAIQLFSLLGIAREDREKRAEWMKKGFRFFDAPAAIIISADTSMAEISQFDVGSISQTIALTALNYGLGTCIQGQGIMYPDVIRKFTGIPESKVLCICLTIGYPDGDFAANQIKSERESVDNITTWCGF